MPIRSTIAQQLVSCNDRKLNVDRINRSELRNALVDVLGDPMWPQQSFNSLSIKIECILPSVSTIFPEHYFEDQDV